ncbi:MAG: MFS transporter [Deltaproteobacteria bacterium]|nr:MAG: MFS transporter [Deltaproteobacteria bacterium]
MRGMYNAAPVAARRAASSMRAPHAEAGAPAADDRLLTPRFLRVTAANFCFFLTFASFFLLPLHVRELGGSERTIGLVMGTSGVSGLVAVLVVAVLLDRVGRRRFLLGGTATMAVASAGFLFVHAIGPALYTLRVVQGLAFAAAFNAASTLAVAFAPATRRAAALGLFGVSTLTTHALAPALGELVIAVAGFPLLFALAACWSVVAFAIAWTVPEASPPEAAAEGGVRLAPTREVVTALGTVCCCGVAFGAVITYVPTFTLDARLGPVAVFFMVYTGAAVMSRVLGGGLGDRRGHRPVIVAALALFTLSVIALAGARSSVGLAGAGNPTLNAFTVDRAHVAELGRAQTLYNGAFNLGTTTGSLALGHVAEVFGHRAMFRVAAAVVGAAFVIFSAGTRARSRTPRRV